MRHMYQIPQMQRQGIPHIQHAMQRIHTNTKNQKITFSDKQKFLIDILRNDEQNNEKPETFIKLITDNCKKTQPAKTYHTKHTA